MSDSDEIAARRELTFEQAEGVERLPSQLALRVVTPELRALLWHAVNQLLLADRASHTFGYVLSGRMAIAMRAYCITRLAMMADELSDDYAWNVEVAKSRFKGDDYVKIFGFIQWLMRDLRSTSFAKTIATVLSTHRAAYRVIETEFTIAPLASEEEARTVSGALHTLQASNLGGGRKHLIDAARLLTEGEYASSVRESIHAVESTVRSKTGKAKFSDAIRELDSRDPMHGSFRGALEKLYGYASDEQGGRHAILEAGSASVKERDAIFMLGACSAFITFVLSGSS